MERNLLQKPNFPNVDLEVYGCNRLPGCESNLEESIHHFPVRECLTF